VGTDVNQSHKEQYYSMILKSLAWINGKAREQYEVVKPVVTLRKYRLVPATREGYASVILTRSLRRT